MTTLTDGWLDSLGGSDLVGHTITVMWKRSSHEYRLIECRANGMKGIVWKAIDDIGRWVAIKLIPPEEYNDHSMLDEMTEAAKLSSSTFAQLIFFGDVDLSSLVSGIKLKVIVSEWVDGIPLDAFLASQSVSVAEFVTLAENLFKALAVLRQSNLCHDDLHYKNILLQRLVEPLSNEATLLLKIVDTGSLKRPEARERELDKRRSCLQLLIQEGAPTEAIDRARKRFELKKWDDHLKVVESLLLAANSLVSIYSRLDSWERKFIDGLKPLLDRLVDEDLERRLDDPGQAVSQLHALMLASKRVHQEKNMKLSTPFDYISAEMIQNDREFMELFSRECPWLEDCKALEPLYIYGPRGCGKSSILRWLSLKTQLSNPAKESLADCARLEFTYRAQWSCALGFGCLMTAP